MKIEEMYMTKIDNRYLIIKGQPFDVMQYFYSSVQNPVIRCCIYFDGRIYTDKLKSAIRQLIIAYPIMRCTFDYNKRIWTETNFSEKDLLSIFYQEDDTDTYKKYLLPLRIGIDPPLKVNLIHRATNDFLCITASHLICDGRGFEQILYTLSDFYSGGKLGVYNTDRSFQQIIKQVPLNKKIEMLFTKSMSISPIAKHQIPFTESNGKPNLITRQLNRDSFFNIKSYAKSNDASMNDVFLAAYCKALHDMFKWNTISLPCPVDLRKFNKSAATNVCNLTGNYHCALQIDSNDSLDNILKKVSCQLTKQKNSFHCLKEPLLYHLLYPLIPSHLLMTLFPRIAPVPVLSYTNLGKLDPIKLVFKGIDITNVFISTAIKPIPYFQLSVSTYKEICTLSCCTLAQGKDLTMIHNLMNKIQTILAI